ncbi:MAG: hypothetical protein OES26_16875 [Gammaproteobacteria bacterium]|nr:hypothetical protein [Gammaproteobacteria bacterium]
MCHVRAKLSLDPEAGQRDRNHDIRIWYFCPDGRSGDWCSQVEYRAANTEPLDDLAERARSYSVLLSERCI